MANVSYWFLQQPSCNITHSKVSRGKCKKNKNNEGKSNYSLLSEKQKPGKTQHGSCWSNCLQMVCKADTDAETAYFWRKKKNSYTCVVLTDIRVWVRHLVTRKQTTNNRQSSRILVIPAVISRINHMTHISKFTFWVAEDRHWQSTVAFFLAHFRMFVISSYCWCL